MRKGLIYSATNNITGKCYIGQTVKGLNNRITGHYYDMNRNACNSKFKLALSKYKKEDWNWNTLIEVDEKLLNDYEKRFISLFDTYKNGYNTSSGGESGYRGVKTSEATKAKQRASSNKNRPWMLKPVQMFDYKTKKFISEFTCTNKASEVSEAKCNSIQNNIVGRSKLVNTKFGKVFFHYKQISNN